MLKPNIKNKYIYIRLKLCSWLFVCLIQAHKVVELSTFLVEFHREKLIRLIYSRPYNYFLP